MAKRRIRRWLQFGVLDLLVLTSIVAVGAVLWRPARGALHRAPPYLLGAWEESETPGVITLFPDGSYYHDNLLPSVNENTSASGIGWSISPMGRDSDVFVLACGNLRTAIRSDWGSGVMELLNDEGGVRLALRQVWRLEGPMRHGQPDGTWQVLPGSGSLEYRHGEPIDAHDAPGLRNLAWLNLIRADRGLPKLTERDFREEVKTKEAMP